MRRDDLFSEEPNSSSSPTKKGPSISCDYLFSEGVKSQEAAQAFLVGPGNPAGSRLSGGVFRAKETSGDFAKQSQHERKELAPP